jgi:hypothetical protein
MPTYKKKRRRNKKTRRNRKRGGGVLRVSRITDPYDNYLDMTITRTPEGKNKNEYSSYIEPDFDLNLDLNEAKYVNSVLFSTLKPSDINKTDIWVRVNNKKEEAQMRLYNYLKKDFEDMANEDNFFNKYFDTLRVNHEPLTTRMNIWKNRPKDNQPQNVRNDYFNRVRNNFPKYNEKNPNNIPQNINELKDDIYPFITDKIVEYFMDQVEAFMDQPTKDKCLSIYIKDNKNTYNNIRYVIMHILTLIAVPGVGVEPRVEPPAEIIPEIVAAIAAGVAPVGLAPAGVGPAGVGPEEIDRNIFELQNERHLIEGEREEILEQFQDINIAIGIIDDIPEERRPERQVARREQLVAILERQVARRDQIEERIRLIDLDLNRLNDERRALIH